MKQAIRFDCSPGVKQFLLLCCFFLPLIIIGYLSLAPGMGPPTIFPLFDKIAHMGAYLVLSLLSRICFPPGRHRHITAFLIAFSILMECLQAFTPPREPSLGDALFNCIGIGIGVVAGIWMRRMMHPLLAFQEKQQSPPA